MTVNLKDPSELAGKPVLGTGDSKLGKVEEVYLDNETDKLEWASIKTGMFGGHVSLVPLANAEYDGSTLRVPYDKELLKAAPHTDPGQDLSQQEEQDLYRHYEMSYAQPSAQPSGERQDRAGRPGVEGRATSGPTTDDAMTRSEEQLHVGTEQVQTGKARLRKVLVTENVTQTVPVSHEEVRIDREPITDANRDQAMAGGDLTEEEHEVTLTEERATVAKETVPVERVRLGTETVTGEETVNESVRKEQIDTDANNPKQR